MPQPNADAVSNSYSHTYCYPNGHTFCYAERYRHPKCNTECYPNSDTYCDTNGNTKPITRGWADG